MSMFVDVMINRDLIGRVQVQNVTAGGPDPGVEVHTYDWTFLGDGERMLVGRLTHRYSDGAMVLAHKVLGEVARRYQVAAFVNDGRALVDDGVVDAEICCSAEHPVITNHTCGLPEGHEGAHQTTVFRWPA